MNILKSITTICTFPLLLTSYPTHASSSTLLTSSTPKSPLSDELTMIVGTYTGGTSKGLYSFRFDQHTGIATPLSHTEIKNPSYFTVSNDGKQIYAVSELGEQEAAVTAFDFDATQGTFKRRNTERTFGADPCNITTNGQVVVTANYSGGNASIFPLRKDGTLEPMSTIEQFKGKGMDPKRQAKPHLHCVIFSPDGKYLFANDLGTDHIYRFDHLTKGRVKGQPKDGTKSNTKDVAKDHAQNNFESSAKSDADSHSKGSAHHLKLNPSATLTLKAGSGPRHLTFAPNGKQAYLINELSGTVVVFDYKKGKLTPKQEIAADTVNAQGSADIHVSPDGAFLYASNRLKADGIAIFKIDRKTGQLTKVGYQLTGIHPRHFNITPNGKYLLVACRDNNAIQVFERDPRSGLLTKTDREIKVDQPVCVKWVN